MRWSPTMTPGVFVTGSEPASGKSAVALGVQQLLARRIGRLGVFRPVVAHPEHDPILDLLRPNGADFVPYAASYGVGYAEVRADEERALEQIVARYRALAAQCEGVLAVGTDFANLGTTGELAFNARVALNLGLPALCVVSGHERTAKETCEAITGALQRLKSAGCHVVAVVANRVQEDCLLDVKIDAGVPIYAVPEVDLLMAPTVGQIASAVGGEMIAGDPELLEREALQILVAAMTLPNLMDRIEEGSLLITPGDRSEVLLAALFAHASTQLPSPAGVILTGGLRPPEKLLRPLEGFPTMPPIILTELDTYATATLAGSREGVIAPDTPRKIVKSLALFEAHVDGDDLLDRVEIARCEAVTPLMFEYTLLDRARERRRHIVLPEGTEERVLRAAETLLRRRVVELTLLGNEEAVLGAAGRLGLDLRGARVLDPTEETLRERMAQEYAQRRAHKGMTIDAARDIVTDVSYFGTLMVALGMCDGMVSGATHTTAETIRPAFELVKTRAGRDDRLERLLHVPVRPRARLRRLRGQPRPDGRAARRHRHLERRDRGAVRDRPARGDALLLDRQVGCGRRGRARARGDRAGARAGAGALRRGPDPVRRRGRRRRGEDQAPRQRRRGPRDRVHLPRPQHRQQHLQGRAAQRRRDRRRPGPAGAQQAGQRPLARRDGARHRQHGGDHGDPGADEGPRRSTAAPRR